MFKVEVGIHVPAYTDAGASTGTDPDAQAHLIDMSQCTSHHAVMTTIISPPTPLSRPWYDIFSGAVHIKRPHGALEQFHAGGSVVGLGVAILVKQATRPWEAAVCLEGQGPTAIVRLRRRARAKVGTGQTGT